LSIHSPSSEAESTKGQTERKAAKQTSDVNEESGDQIEDAGEQSLEAREDCIESSVETGEEGGDQGRVSDVVKGLGDIL
jgi:hypothetical protein